MSLVMGTAGHIDHGKTTLVRALTGIDCDRLGEEKRRGITIELGFAYMDLPDGSRLGIVDVPGHEKFVKNMVAGAAGLDFVMLVIAADEGVMPQTREHLEICSLLGIERGLVALTKTDMVDEDWLELVLDDLAEFLDGTFLQDAPIVPVSAQSGAGLDELKARLAEVAAACGSVRRMDLLRLPVDRVFSMKGHGTVVTGTLISGTLAVNDRIMAYPEDREGKVRSIQRHGASEETAHAGERTAVNLHGLEVEDLQRGDILAAPGSLIPSKGLDVELTLLSSAHRGLKHRKEFHFHMGSREQLGRVHLLETEQLEPGETAVCQIRFDEPVCAVFGDRFVIRSFSPLRTIGGGRVIGPVSHKIKRFSDQVDRLRELAGDDPALRIASQLKMAGERGVNFAGLRIMSGLEDKKLEKQLSEMGAKQKALLFDKEEHGYVSGEVLERLGQDFVAHLAGYHKANPMQTGQVRVEAASGWGRNLSEKLFQFLVARLVKRGEVVQEGELLRLPEHKVSLASDQEKLRTTILKAFTEGGQAPPNVKDVLEPLDLTFKDAAGVFRLLTEQGELRKIKEDMYYFTPALQEIVAAVEVYFKDHDDLGPSQLREITGLSRKYVIPLLEFMDKEKITVRVGDRRILRNR
ncbi:MAG: selenocysteine-specific translation elongation factor [Desulfovibrio sp.]|uniref:selenocysteine-specific translation elongation factor n=1 Tax=Desulfovibrio sp. 7SRBS1 TaxID=3378064 RepID=UPI003B416BBD